MNESQFAGRYENHDDFEAYEATVVIPTGQSLNVSALSAIIVELISAIEQSSGTDHGLVAHAESDGPTGSNARDSEASSPDDQMDRAGEAEEGHDRASG